MRRVRKKLNRRRRIPRCQVHGVDQTSEQIVVNLRILTAEVDGMDGVVRDVKTIKTMQNDLHDESHYLVGRTKGEERSQGLYSIGFASSLYVKREEP